MTSDTALGARLDAAIDKALAENRLVGAVVLAARDGEVVHARAAGFADREAGAAMRRDAIFRHASLTKAIVSAAALALAEAGVLSVEDPVTRFLPDFRPKLADGTEPVITLRHLLTHTSGLTYDFMEPDDSGYHALGISNGIDGPGVAMADNLAKIALWPLAFPPGTAWNYGLSTDVLGAALAAAAGKTLAEVVRAKVTGPLGMVDTDFAVTDPARLATAYADANLAPIRMPERHALPFAVGSLRYAPGRILDPNSYHSGGGGMAGTADEYLRFLEAIRTGGAPILSPAGAELMTHNAIGDIPVALLGPGSGFSLGAGVLTDPAATGSPSAAGTWSWGGVYGSSWFVDPVNRLTVVALTNTAVEGTIGQFTIDVRMAAYGV